MAFLINIRNSRFLYVYQKEKIIGRAPFVYKLYIVSNSIVCRHLIYYVSVSETIRLLIKMITYKLIVYTVAHIKAPDPSS